MDSDSGGNQGQILRELKSRQIQLAQAERRASALQQSQDALNIKIEQSQDATNELMRHLEATMHQRELLTAEVTAKHAALAEGAKERAKADAVIAALKSQLAQLKEKVAKAEIQVMQRTKATQQINVVLDKERERSQQLQSSADSLAGQLAAMKSQHATAEVTIQDLRKEVGVVAAQLRDSKAALEATLCALQLAQREALRTGQVQQRSKEVSVEVDLLQREVQHLGRELLRAQDVAARSEARANLLPSSAWSEGLKRHPDDASSTMLQLEAKAAALQRRLVVLAESAAAQQSALRGKDEEIQQLKRSLEILKAGDCVQQELARVRAAVSVKTKELRAAKAEAAAVRKELAEREEIDERALAQAAMAIMQHSSHQTARFGVGTIAEAAPSKSTD